MSNSTTLKTRIMLRKDTAANFEALGSGFVPLHGEMLLVITVSDGIRIKVGDGATSYLNLPYIDEKIYESINDIIVRGYYLNDKFYTDSTYQTELEKSIHKTYIDNNSNVVYHYDGSAFISVNDTLPTASDSVAGIMKLYQTSGSSTDGAMSQKTVTDGVNSIKFALDTSENECLVLDLPWD